MGYKSTDDLPLVISVEKVAEILDISKNTAYALVRSGQIHGIKVGRQYRITKDALKKYLETSA